MLDDMDEFANLPDDDQFDFASLPDDDEIAPTENILQKAAKAAQSALGQNNMDLPFGPGMSFANNMKREMMGLQPEAKMQRGDVTDFTKDYFTDPRTYAGAFVGASAAKPDLKQAGNFFGRVAQKGKDIATSGRNLKNVQGELSTTERMLGEANSRRTSTEGELASNALSQSAKNKQAIRSTAKANTDIYGENLDILEENLAKSGRTPTREDYFQNVLSKTLSEADEMQLPNSPALSKLRSYADRFAPKVEEADPTKVDLLGMSIKPEAQAPTQLTLDELKNLKNSIYKKQTSGVKNSTAYATPEDKVADMFLKNHGDFLGGLDDEIKAMNAEFAPYARSRKFGYKAFKPNSPEEVQRGANILQRIAGKGKPNADEANYLGRLEEGSGRFKGTGDLRGKTTELGQKLALIDDEIAQLESSRGNLLQKQAKLQELKRLRNQIAGTVVGGTTIKVLSD